MDVYARRHRDGAMQNTVILGAWLVKIQDGQAAMAHDLSDPLGNASTPYAAAASEAHVVATEEGGNAGRVTLDADKPRGSVGSFVHGAQRKVAAESQPGRPGHQAQLRKLRRPTTSPDLEHAR
jgi:hypothetical protein